MDYSLSEEQHLVQLMARDFAKKSIEPFALDWDKKKIFPAHVLKEMASLGFMGMMIPESYGGSNTGAITYSLALQEIAYADAGIGVTMSVANLACEPIYKFGTEAQRIKYLIPLASGEKLGAFCLTEPGAGSDPSSMRTKAVLKDDRYILNGTKIFITNGEYAPIFIVIARTMEGGGNRGLSAFIVEKDQPGFSIGTVEDKMGLRSSSTTEVILDDCIVPQENLLGKEGDGFKIAMTALDSGRIGIASQSLGMARACLDEAKNYALQRKQFGKTLSNFQAIQWMIADIATHINAAYHLTLHAAFLKDLKEPFTKEASMAKLFASESLNQIAYKALQIFGGYGYIKDSKIEKLYRDARVTTIYEGTSEVQRIVIARETFLI
ncbi:MAG: acyl-CoA dehydrogenase [Syntrophaceae bacterium CG2_30_49_12]|nr:MAG: acyl-CoA dehydrogenase [Syntrophaceae bacterium CG2_30_49_12]PIP08486.1 MAG: acyl-CoA dehydrogenase [Syntrophobacterales bacterium CG23_combo_of_CG06-09_8_20_14_all_48_27]PJA49813.1 MAG: acyl-CoA dehydrogenase [Syntrophobacterales bacterium CG_4_9_14_3_um_filter_49_8]